MNQPSQVAGHQHDDAWEVDWLRVDDIHELYYQQYGKKDGKPGMSDDVRETYLCILS
jgi:proline iminopeptidase